MKRSVSSKLFILLFFLLFMVVFSGSAVCQEINLDKMKKVGDLVCYPSLKDPNAWYYLPNQPRLATKDGKPQFSFMKYSRTSKTGKAGINDAEGGGIVHFLVTYGTGKNRVDEAQRRLKEQFPDAHIEGPIAYRKGSFALITSFNEGQQSLVKTVAVGKAPLMEGQKAAVSMALSREGAALLWESFKGDTPDISLVFDMEFAGVREPYEATIEADWSQVSRHKRLKAGMKYSWFGADVDMLFQELRQTGAIKIITKGENATMDKIIESANAKLLQVMFDPAPVDDLAKASAQKDSYSSLNQAMKMLNDSKAAGAKTSELDMSAPVMDLNTPGFRQLISAIIDAVIPQAMAEDNSGLTDTIKDAADQTAQPENQLKNKEAEQDTGKTSDSIAQALDQSASEMYNRARRLDEAARESGFKQEETLAAFEAYLEYLEKHPDEGPRRMEVEGRIRSLEQRLTASGLKPPPPPDASLNLLPDLLIESSEKGKPADTPKTASTPKSTDTPAAPPAATGFTTPAKTDAAPSAASPAAPAKTAPTSAVKKAVEKAPGFSLVASFQMKNIKRSGKMVYHMNHFRTEMQSFTMTENIGNLYSRYQNDTQVFKAVTIDDPVFKQREVLVTLDGQDASTFTKYLNFVTVKMKKQHQSGAVTNDEIVITPEAFNTSGNSFSLNYGYKDDTDRDRWLAYQYQVIWSFHGGLEIRSPWKDENSPMLALSPPYRYRSLTIEGEGETLDQANIRHAVITVSSRINGKQIITQATVKNQGPAPSLHLDIPEDVEADRADVSIKWFLKGGKQVDSDVRNLDSDIIYWDELP